MTEALPAGNGRKVEIGSEFELVGSRYLLPTKRPKFQQSQLLRTGREALLAAADTAMRHGLDRVIVPHYHCESMSAPFIARGFAVQVVQTDAQGLFLPEAVRNAAREPALILHSETFGSVASSALRSALSEARRDGSLLLVDETHTVLADGFEDADIRIASLRKLLPVADGAYFRSRFGPVAAIAETSEFTRMRIKAAQKKTSFLAGDSSSKCYLDMFREAEASLTGDDTINAMSDESKNLLDRLDVDAIKAQRAQNVRAILGALDGYGIRVLNREGALRSLSYVVVVTPHALRVRSSLASLGIYCPVHWPKPDIVGGELAWRTDLISIPVDHRYAPDEMRYVGGELRRAIDLG